MSIADVLGGRARWTVEHTDALSLLRSLPDNSIDSTVSDPPAGISFMNRSWDKDKGGRDQWVAWLTEIMREALRVLKPGAHALVWALPRTSHWTATALEDAGFEIRDVITHHFGSGFPKSLDASKAIDKKLGKLAEREVVSIYTAGGNAGTSTADKGGTFVVGAPNSPAVTLTRTIGATPEAREWDGYGTALKPGSEHWILCRKPLPGTLAENLMEHGTGALNIDGTRVATDWNEPDRPESWKRSGHTADADADKIAAPPGAGIDCHPGGRWPANVVFTHSAGCVRRGTATVAGDNRGDCSGRRDGGFFATGSKSGTGEPNARVYGTETVPAYDCAPDCPVAALARQSGEMPPSFRVGRAGHARLSGVYGESKDQQDRVFGHHDSGTAARFFHQFEWDDEAIELNHRFLYAAKPSRAEREAGCERLQPKTAGEVTGRKDGTDGLKSPRAGAGRTSNGRRNVHPTVKGDALMRFLTRLVTPPKGICLDIFTGSGSTGRAAVLEGFRFIGCELNDTDEEPFVSIARARIAHVIGGAWEQSKPKQATEAVARVGQMDLFGRTGS